MQFPIILPEINPNIISIGPIGIRWYSVAYILGILFCWFLLKYFNNKKPIMNKEAWDDWLFWAILGIVLGGRIGYVLFYNFDFYIQHPKEIFAVWQGGMSFHGGLIGSLVAMFLFCKKYKVSFFELTDILAIAAPIGLFLGRIANFVNMELYGRVTGSDFGVIFPNAGYLPRHPSQLYEAFLEGLLLFAILFSLSKLTKIREKVGALSALFLIFYGSARIFIEQFREPDQQLGFLFFHITMGQILSMPLIIGGIIILIFSFKNRPAPSY
ncbi:MAG: prolipoprotein diacylglyceryl transferase [Rickettsiaceae bacterium]|jgi:phosphatidylglycerol:prolipoprotein diacylglycerol transferase|nr:prolipoprotein diacylglyceryl transferase [Rickettsiaceae bacterium]